MCIYADISCVLNMLPALLKQSMSEHKRTLRCYDCDFPAFVHYNDARHISSERCHSSKKAPLRPHRGEFDLLLQRADVLLVHKSNALKPEGVKKDFEGQVECRFFSKMLLLVFRQ